jgi:hypothetical protein
MSVFRINIDRDDAQVIYHGLLRHPFWKGNVRLNEAASPFSKRPLKWGEQGTAIRLLQEALQKTSGFDLRTGVNRFVRIDGVFHDQTYYAVRRFQEAWSRRLVSLGCLPILIDGIPGPQTLHALDECLMNMDYPPATTDNLADPPAPAESHFVRDGEWLRWKD